MKRSVIVFCGTRGVPANYGGFETAVDEISQAFVRSGYNVEVFCRSSSCKDQPIGHEGRTLVYVNGSKSSKLDTFVSSIQTGLCLIRQRKRYGQVFWFNNANLPGILMTLLAGIPTTVNTDGLEWRRKKWKLPFKIYYFLSSLLISLVCKRLISDSRAIQNYYKRIFHKNTIFIPYGVPNLPYVCYEDQQEHLRIYDLEAGKYFLQITRFEPDNYPLEVAKGFAASGLDKLGYKHVVVGYKGRTTYSEQLKALSGKKGVIVLPAVYDPAILYSLRKNSFCYMHGNSVGGTNPALLEAMAVCPRIMAIDCEFTHEMLGDMGSFFNPQKMEKNFREALSIPDCSQELSKRVNENYQWDAVSEAYIQIVKGNLPIYRPLKCDEEDQLSQLIAVG